MAENYRISLAAPEDRDEWQRFTTTLPQIVGFATPEFQSILRKAYGLVSTAWLARRTDGQLVGVLLTYYVDWHSSRKELHTPPYGLQVAEAPAASALLGALRTFCHRCGIVKTQVESAVCIEETDCLTWTKPTIVKVLAENLDEDWKNLRGKTRNIIRKAKASDVQVMRGFEHLDAWYTIYLKRMVEIQVPPQSKQFFRLMASLCCYS